MLGLSLTAYQCVHLACQRVSVGNIIEPILLASYTSLPETESDVFFSCFLFRQLGSLGGSHGLGSVCVH